MFLFEDYLNKIYRLRMELGNDCDEKPEYKEKVLKEFEAYLVDSEEYYDKLNQFYEYIRGNPVLFLKFIGNIFSLWKKYGEDRLVNREYYRDRNRLFRQTFIGEPNQDIFDNFNTAIRSDLEELEKISQEAFLFYIKGRVYFQYVLEKVKGAAISDIQERIQMVNKLIQELANYEFSDTPEPLKLKKVPFGLFSKKKREMVEKLNEERKGAHKKEEKRIEERNQAIEERRVILKKRFEEVIEQLGEISNNLGFVKTVKQLDKIKGEIDSIASEEIEKLWKKYPKEFILTEGFKQEVVSIYKEKSKNEPDDAEIHNILGTDYLNKNMIEQASEEFKKAIELNVNHLDAYKNLWWVYYDNNLLDQGIQYFEKRIETNPGDVAAHNWLGYSYHHKKLYDKAIKEYHQSIVLNCNFALPYLNRAWAYADKESYDEAIIRFKGILGEVNLKPAFSSVFNQDYCSFGFRVNFRVRDASVHYGLGMAYYGKEKHPGPNDIVSYLKEAAVRDIKESLNIEPNNPEVYFQLANIYKEWADEITKCGSHSLQGWPSLQEIAEENYKEAIKNYESALKCRPNKDLPKEITKRISECIVRKKGIWT